MVASVALLALTALTALGTSSVRAGAASPLHNGSTEEPEYPLKAAFLLHFIRYTTWPKASFRDDTSPIVVTVVGKDPFGDVLENTFRGEEAHGRKLQVARTKEVPAEVTGHVVFCAELSKAERELLLERCDKRAVLLIGETKDFAQRGACINFYLPQPEPGRRGPLPVPCL